MTLNQIVEEIISRTKRVDKRTEIVKAVRKAILMVHTAAYFPRDMVEELVDLNGTYANFKVPLPPRVRKFAIVAPMDINGNPIRNSTKDNTLQYVDATDLITSVYERKSDVYYVVGPNITVRSTVGMQKLYMNFYASPEVSDGNLETWLMRDYDHIFIDAALGSLYLILGRPQVANSYKQDLMLELQTLIDTYVNMGDM